jgi:hypothetical protein
MKDFRDRSRTITEVTDHILVLRISVAIPIDVTMQTGAALRGCSSQPLRLLDAAPGCSESLVLLGVTGRGIGSLDNGVSLRLAKRFSAH